MQVLAAVERVYGAVLRVENHWLREQSKQEGLVAEDTPAAPAPSLAALTGDAARVISAAMGLAGSASDAPEDPSALAEALVRSGQHHFFIHFLTVPKGCAVVPRALRLVDDAARRAFLFRLVGLFDFLAVIRPETPLAVVDTFIAQVLSPLVPFVGDADWPVVLQSLRALFAKRSFVWIALTKPGTVLLCILLSRLEILKAAAAGDAERDREDLADAAALTERIFDCLSDHLPEFFPASAPVPVPVVPEDNREFYSWQLMALLAMNVDADRQRAMVVELREGIMRVVEQGDAAAIGRLNVFLNALGLDASQLKQ